MADDQELFEFYQSIEQGIKLLVLAFDEYDFVIEWQNSFADVLLGSLEANQQLPATFQQLWVLQQAKGTVDQNKAESNISLLSSLQGTIVKLAIQWSKVPHPIVEGRSLTLLVGFPLGTSSQIPNELLAHYRVFHDDLTKREKEIFNLVTQGKSTTEIANLINRSPHTIESHRSNIIKKFAVKRFQELISLAVYLKLSK